MQILHRKNKHIFHWPVLLHLTTIQMHKCFGLQDDFIRLENHTFQTVDYDLAFGQRVPDLVGITVKSHLHGLHIVFAWAWASLFSLLYSLGLC